MMQLYGKLKPYVYPITFLVAVASIAGSLYFSEVLLFAPCVLCWYQRITMYPVAVIALVAMWRRDERAYTYILPLMIIGSVIAAYHSFLYYAVNWGIRPDWVGPCQAGVSCTANYVTWLGFITIPLLSLAAHLFVIVLLMIAWKSRVRTV